MPGEIVDVLQFAIDGVSQRQNSIANNLANAQTPGFSATETNFESSLDKALTAGGPASATVTSAPSPNPPGTNGNNVTVADELLAAEKAALQFQTVSESLNAQFRIVAGSAGGTYS